MALHVLGAATSIPLKTLPVIFGASTMALGTGGDHTVTIVGVGAVQAVILAVITAMSTRSANRTRRLESELADERAHRIRIETDLEEERGRRDASDEKLGRYWAEVEKLRNGVAVLASQVRALGHVPIWPT